jgi:hypothetical protein
LCGWSARPKDKTLNDRIDVVADAIKEIRRVEKHRRNLAGPQLERDHDNSATYQPQLLPTYNP